MNAPEAAILLVALLFGLVILSPLEHNLGVYCLASGVFALTIGRQCVGHLFCCPQTVQLIWMVLAGRNALRKTAVT
jgi:hypothetical protein